VPTATAAAAAHCVRTDVMLTSGLALSSVLVGANCQQTPPAAPTGNNGANIGQITSILSTT